MRDLLNGICLLIVICAMMTAHTGKCSDIEINSKNAEIVKAISFAADAFKIPRPILLAICYHESALRNHGVTHMDGHSFSYGVCQVKLTTALFMDKIYGNRVKATGDKLNNPRYNALYAAAYLKYQKHKYKNWKLAIDAYNKHTPIHDHTKYVKAVLNDIGRFTLLSEKVSDLMGESSPAKLQKNTEQILLN